MPVPERMRRVLSLRTLEAISHLCVMAGIGFAVLQYVAAQEDGRVSATLRSLDTFYQPRLTEARTNLLDFAASELAQYSGKSGSEAVVATLAESYILKQDGAARRDLTLVLEHLDFLAICARVGTCDADLAFEQLCPFAMSILTLYDRPIQRLRSDYGMRYLGTATEQVFRVGCTPMA